MSLETRQTPEHTTRVNLFLNTQTLTGIQCQHSFGVVTWNVFTAYEQTECFFIGVHNRNMSRGSSVSRPIVSDYGLDYRAIGVRFPAGTKDFFFSSLCVQTGSEVHPAFCTMGTGVLSQGIKCGPGRDADHLPPSSAQVENE
jgi:hypothetical protein